MDDYEGSKTKKQKILDAAYEVFSRKGYSRATVDEIINLADTGKGTVYNYFVNKEQLFYTLIEECSRPFETDIEKIAYSDKSCLEKINELIKMFLAFHVTNVDLWRVFIHEVRAEELSCSAISPEVSVKFHDMYRRVIAIVENVIAEGIAEGIFRGYDAKWIASLFIGIILTTAYKEKLTGDDITKVAENIIEVFLYGLTARR